MGGLAAKALALAGEILFPPVCLACRKRLLGPNRSAAVLCDDCLARLRPNPFGCFCPECGRRLLPQQTALPDNHPHAQFIVVAPLSYADPVARGVIHSFKYKGAKAAAGFLAQMIVSALEDNGPALGDAVIIPVPLHPSREKERGFNQSLLIAEELVHREPLRATPVLRDALVKVRHTESQTKKMSAAARAENIAGSFVVRDASAIAGRNVFLVDDVFTTGATLRAAARALKESGARRIIALVAARA